MFVANKKIYIMSQDGSQLNAVTDGTYFALTKDLASYSNMYLNYYPSISKSKASSDLKALKEKLAQRLQQR